MQITQIWAYHFGLIVSLLSLSDTLKRLEGSYDPLPAVAWLGSLFSHITRKCAKEKAPPKGRAFQNESILHYCTTTTIVSEAVFERILIR